MCGGKWQLLLYHVDEKAQHSSSHHHNSECQMGTRTARQHSVPAQEPKGSAGRWDAFMQLLGCMHACMAFLKNQQRSSGCTHAAIISSSLLARDGVICNSVGLVLVFCCMMDLLHAVDTTMDGRPILSEVAAEVERGAIVEKGGYCFFEYLNY